MEYLELAKLANAAKEFAYSPYYKFRVGAAVLTKNGKVYTGCNIETGAGFSMCAERVAMAKAISEGNSNFVAVAVASDQKEFVSPCGVCRQFMREFSKDLDIVLYNGSSIKTYKLSELLPHSFGLK